MTFNIKMMPCEIKFTVESVSLVYHHRSTNVDFQVSLGKANVFVLFDLNFNRLSTVSISTSHLEQMARCQSDTKGEFSLVVTCALTL